MKSSKRIIFDDNENDGFDTNSSFEIKSTSPGINAKFNNDGSKLIVTGKKEGNVTLKLSYDDDPEDNGTAIKEIIPLISIGIIPTSLNDGSFMKILATSCKKLLSIIGP